MAHTPDMQPHTQAIHHTHLNPVIPHLLRSTVLVPLWPIYHRRHHLITRHRLLWQHLLHLHLLVTHRHHPLLEPDQVHHHRLLPLVAEVTMP